MELCVCTYTLVGAMLVFSLSSSFSWSSSPSSSSLSWTEGAATSYNGLDVLAAQTPPLRIMDSLMGHKIKPPDKFTSIFPLPRRPEMNACRF
ncbi:hypothetical protein M0804_001270 [Polistes exclamans]|nr:hypothetical protein M0804_001270 [Polistes exclamans]